MVEFANRFEQRAWQRRAAAAWHCICILILCTSSILNSAGAATFEVDDSDAGKVDLPDIAPGDRNCQAANNLCTLRAAIEESNALAGLDRVELAPGRYVLALGELRVSDSLTLIGASADSTLIDGCTRHDPATGRCTVGSRVLVIGPRPADPGQAEPSPPNVTVANVTITGGLAASNTDGAGVVNRAGSFLVLMKTIVSDNIARQFGGGVTNGGSLRIVDSIIRNNTLPLGGGGQTSSGGGLFNFSGASLDIARSLITGNTATRGGGIRNAGGRLQIFNTTISGNTAFARGGGIMNFGVADIGFSTITLNRANTRASGEPTVGGGIFNAGTINLASTIIAENSDNRTRSSPDFLQIALARTSSDSYHFATM